MDRKDIRDNLDLIDFLKFKFLYLLNSQLNLILSNVQVSLIGS